MINLAGFIVNASGLHLPTSLQSIGVSRSCSPKSNCLKGLDYYDQTIKLSGT